MLAVQSCAYGSEDGVLTADMIKKVIVNRYRIFSQISIMMRTL